MGKRFGEIYGALGKPIPLDGAGMEGWHGAKLTHPSGTDGKHEQDTEDRATNTRTHGQVGVDLSTVRGAGTRLVFTFFFGWPKGGRGWGPTVASWRQARGARLRTGAEVAAGHGLDEDDAFAFSLIAKPS